MRVSHNIFAMNTNRMLGINDTKMKKSVERLSSGYRINRAADDAAGLSISEKMRRLIRGLDQGTKNAEDGVSWNQIGDGALNEAHEILHRMTELTVKSLNGTNSDSDRMALELEFEALQCELDKIANTTEFNDIPLFDKHQVPYYECEGSVKWDPQQMHVVTEGSNDLTFTYRDTLESPQQTVTITVPAGEYTTQELVDEIESALGQGKLVIEFDDEGYCNATIEGGEMIDSLSGGLSYLVYDMYKGGSYGALIGTTSFPYETSRLRVVTGQNDNMSFTIEDFAGGSTQKTITIPQGSYTRSEIIDMLNNRLSDTSVQAIPYGTGIKLASDDAIVTGFKGNMFKIDGSGTVYNSVFYDNVQYGTVTKEPAVFTGGYVLPVDSRDEEHKYYRIDSSNNTLTLQPNGAAAPVSLTIPDGEYTAAQMETQLNLLFTGAGLALTAKRIATSYYEGIKITSGIEGIESKIGIDTSSSAYNTLFVTREYNSYGSPVNPVNETRTDREGSFTGSKDLNVYNSTTPLTVTAGSNDKFKLVLNGTGYDITMTAKTYNSVQEIVDEINNQLNGASAPIGYKGKLEVSQFSGKIVLTGVTGEGVNTVRVQAITGNTGFDDIFQGYNTSITYPSASGSGYVVLNTPYDGNIDSSETNMNITVDGTDYTVILPEGDLSQEQLKNAIETQIPGKTEEIPNKFNPITASGTNDNNDFTKIAQGTTVTSSWGDSAQGTANEAEGVVDLQNNTPARLQIGVPLKDSMVVTSSNNQITLTLGSDTGNQTKIITLDNGTYTPTSLASALQSKIDAAFGTGMGGAIVSVNGTTMTLTSRLPDGYDGRETYIQCNTTNSSFLKELNTTRGPAEWVSTNQLASNIVIDSSNQTFTFSYTEAGNTQTVSLTLAQGTYTPASIGAEINRLLAGTSTGITASGDSGRLELTSSAVGNDVRISYSTTSGGNSAEALFGPLNEPGPAERLVQMDTEDEIVIEAGTSDTFTIHVNGTPQTVTLDPGTYNRTSFVNMLNTKLTGVEAYVSGKRIGYRTTATGTSASVAMTYDGGGNSMKAIYGVTIKEYPGITVTFEPDGRMGLGTTIPGKSIVVPSGSGGMQEPVINKTPISTSYSDGYHSATKSYIDGTNWSGDILIDKWNNDLSFTYTDNGSAQNVTIQIPENITYTQTELQDKLQELIDAQTGAGKIVVTVNASGVRLEAANVGSQYKFSAFGGDFYHKVICPCTEQSRPQSVMDKDGTQNMSKVFTVGRKNIVDEPVVIRQGISDELSVDLTYGGNTKTISVTLDSGEYGAQAIKNHLQEKINEQLVANGLPENLITVGVGDIRTNVSGANDASALNFQLSQAVDLPEEGQYIIDGVRGNAAFELFYQTDGKLIPAYIIGAKNVTDGVEVYPGETDLGLKVDGVDYTITIPEGRYSPDSLLTTMNDAFDAGNIPVVAELNDGRVKISHRKMGEHSIEAVSGLAKDEIFFEENTELDNITRHVQLSSETEDQIELKNHWFSTVALGLNSCCISKVKNAEKALDRINGALKKINDIRSDYGSTQNRLEHAINNNENKSENLQSAESIIRDTDMALEMVANSNYSILLQAGQAMLAQANQSNSGVMRLLS